MSLICPFSPGVGKLSYENDEDARGKIIRMKPLNLTNLDMAKPHRVSDRVLDCLNPKGLIEAIIPRTRPEVNNIAPNRGHYVAQLRNSSNIRETVPESRTRVKFCGTDPHKIPIL